MNRLLKNMDNTIFYLRFRNYYSFNYLLLEINNIYINDTIERLLNLLADIKLMH